MCSTPESSFVKWVLVSALVNRARLLCWRGRLQSYSACSQLHHATAFPKSILTCSESEGWFVTMYQVSSTAKDTGLFWSGHELIHCHAQNCLKPPQNIHMCNAVCFLWHQTVILNIMILWTINNSV